MKSKLPSICPIGQRSLSSSFLIKPSTPTSSKDSIDENLQSKPFEEKKKKKSSISLSQFLNRKLDADSPPTTKSIPQKRKPFSSLVVDKDTIGTLDKHEHIGVKRGAGMMDETVFQQFKYPRKGNEEYNNSNNGGGEVGQSTAKSEHDLRKRRNPFDVSSAGGKERHSTPKHLVILGDDPKPKQNGRDFSSTSNKKPRMLFNHYANGSGSWDCNMAGIDNEEVGCGEAWEGMGSTTLGGMDWH